MRPPDRLGELLREAACGRFPPVDGVVEVLPEPAGRADAVVAFTGHNVVACPLPAHEVLALVPPDDPYGGPMTAGFLHRLGERLDAEPGMIDAVLAVAADARPSAAPLPVERADAVDHARVERSLRYRDGVEAFAAEGGVLTIGRGLTGRIEVAVEVDEPSRGGGLGRALAVAGLVLAPPAEPVFAQVSPGNAASLRAFLAAGYRPIGSEVLFLRR